MDMGGSASLALFGDDGEPCVSLVDFTHGACADAWHGRNVVLADLPAAMRTALMGRDWRPEQRSRLLA
jgi:hypothetical protein